MKNFKKRDLYLYLHNKIISYFFYIITFAVFLYFIWIAVIVPVIFTTAVAFTQVDVLSKNEVLILVAAMYFAIGFLFLKLFNWIVWKLFKVKPKIIAGFAILIIYFAIFFF